MKSTTAMASVNAFAFRPILARVSSSIVSCSSRFCRSISPFCCLMMMFSLRICSASKIAFASARLFALSSRSIRSRSS
jgi:hypothetical protein